jgi:hypothetical protein
VRKVRIGVEAEGGHASDAVDAGDTNEASSVVAGAVDDVADVGHNNRTH